MGTSDLSSGVVLGLELLFVEVLTCITLVCTANSTIAISAGACAVAGVIWYHKHVMPRYEKAYRRTVITLTCIDMAIFLAILFLVAERGVTAMMPDFPRKLTHREVMTELVIATVLVVLALLLFLIIK